MKFVHRHLVCTLLLTAALPCHAQRYLADVFDTLTVTPDIVYGIAHGPGADAETLKLDLYEPAGDTLLQRPLLILIHGGSFTGGSRKDETIASLARTFARKGYVTASISYRLSNSTVLDWDAFLVDTLALFNAAHRAMHDAKASVRFFRKEAKTYRVDDTRIAIGGLSAGAITAVTAGYLNTIDELLPDVEPASVEGFSGTPGYPSDVAAVVSLCGGAIDPVILDSPDEPRLYVAHDRGDPVVPFNLAEDLYRQALAVGVPAESEFFVWGLHCSFSDPNWMEITGSRTRMLISLTLFLAEPLVSVTSRRPERPPNPVHLSIYPNPMDGFAHVRVSDGESGMLEIRNATGKLLRRLPVGPGGKTLLRREGLPAGVYFATYRSNERTILRQMVVVR